MSAGECAARAAQEPGVVPGPPVNTAGMKRHPTAGSRARRTTPATSRSWPLPRHLGVIPGALHRDAGSRGMAPHRAVPSPPSYSPGRGSSRCPCKRSLGACGGGGPGNAPAPPGLAAACVMVVLAGGGWGGKRRGGRSIRGLWTVFPQGSGSCIPETVLRHKTPLPSPASGSG